MKIISCPKLLLWLNQAIEYSSVYVRVLRSNCTHLFVPAHRMVRKFNLSTSSNMHATSCLRVWSWYTSTELAWFKKDGTVRGFMAKSKTFQAFQSKLDFNAPSVAILSGIYNLRACQLRIDHSWTCTITTISKADLDDACDVNRVRQVKIWRPREFFCIWCQIYHGTSEDWMPLTSMAYFQFKLSIQESWSLMPLSGMASQGGKSGAQQATTYYLGHEVWFFVFELKRLVRNGGLFVR